MKGIVFFSLILLALLAAPSFASAQQCANGSCAVPARSGGVFARSETGRVGLFHGEGPVRRLFNGRLFSGRLFGRCR